jgi:hypothetical protein
VGASRTFWPKALSRALRRKNCAGNVVILRGDEMAERYAVFNAETVRRKLLTSRDNR